MDEFGTKKVLFCLLAGLGDAIMAAPTIRSLRHQRPDWKIDAITALGSTHGYVSALAELDSAECEEFLRYPLHRKFLKLLRLRARSYDYVFLPYPAARWQYHAGALLMAGGKLVAHSYSDKQSWVPGYKFTVPATHTSHVVDLNAKLLEGVGLSAQIDRSYVEPSAWNLPPRVPSRRVAFHLVSLSSEINKGNFYKSPPLETYAVTARGLRNAGYEVCAVGAGQEREVAREFEQMCGFPVPFITGSLDQSAAELRKCALIIASESGIAHLGAAIRVPVLCVFGMTDPRRFAPLGDVHVFRPSDCVPCYDPSDRQFACKLNVNFRCTRGDIMPEMLLNRALSALSANEGIEVPA